MVAISKDKTNSIVSDSEEGLSGFDKSIHMEDMEETTKQKEKDLKKKRMIRGY